jgi:tRNA A-37 threonylcarbamoyl transferase component Bud32
MLHRVEPSASGPHFQELPDTAPRQEAATSALEPQRLGAEKSLNSKEEFRALLQRRMAVMWTFGSVVVGLLFLLTVFFPERPFIEPPPGLRGKILLGTAALMMVVGAVMTQARFPAPMHRLRMVETASLVCLGAVLADMRIDVLRTGLAFEGEDGPGRFYLNWVLLYNTFGWLSCVLIESIAIPGTWRRASRYVGALSLVPLAIDAGFASAHPERASLLVVPTIMAVQVLGLGAILALFGSQKMESLRQEALAARKEAHAARALGPYVLGRRLGKGGMGEVYLAEHRLLKRACAVKLIRPEFAADKNSLARFEREAQATARLRHPNTVEVFDFGRADDGAFYYIMEYLDGLNLCEFVDTFGRMAPDRAIYLLRSVCGALGEAHAAGLVHRDIKPNNLFLCHHGGQYDVVKLLDFGIVQDPAEKPLDEKLTMVGSIIGTPDFMSPEQANGASLDARTDIYSLGATAFYLLTGSPPYAGKTALDVMFAHRSEPVPSLRTHVPELGADLDAVVRRCLAKDPADRFDSVTDLDRALRTCSPGGAWSSDKARDWWASHPQADTAPTAPIGEAPTIASAGQ